METILNYLRQLEANNNKPWFDAHKSEYQEARAHFNAIVEKLSLVEQGKINTLPLITHSFPLSRIEEAYRVFENKEGGVIKIAIKIN